MEIERRLVRLERLSFRIYMAGGAVIGALSLLTLAAFGFFARLKPCFLTLTPHESL